MDVKESDSEYYVLYEVNGYKKKNVKIGITL